MEIKSATEFLLCNGSQLVLTHGNSKTKRFQTNKRESQREGQETLINTKCRRKDKRTSDWVFWSFNLDDEFPFNCKVKIYIRLEMIKKIEKREGYMWDFRLYDRIRVMREM